MTAPALSVTAGEGRPSTISLLATAKSWMAGLRRPCREENQPFRSRYLAGYNPPYGSPTDGRIPGLGVAACSFSTDSLPGSISFSTTS
jgi:hypothetical protein